MRALFGSLLCLVFTSTQAFAIKGGPPYPAGTNIVGTYAGVLQGEFDPTDPRSSNSIGIFSVGIPGTGLASGTFIMFAQGRTFTGTIKGTGDPQKSTLKGILNATFNYNLSFLVPGENGAATIETIAVTATVNGKLDAKVQTAGRTTFSNGATLLRGDSTLFIDQGEVSNTGEPVLTGVIALSVLGFKQSNSVVAASGG
jgi:hypothetical protein